MSVQRWVPVLMGRAYTAAGIEQCGLGLYQDVDMAVKSCSGKTLFFSS